MEKPLLGFAFRGYRSFFGDALQVVGPLAKINLVAGQNNSGKSNVLRVAAQLEQLRQTAPSGLDKPRSNSESRFELALNLGSRDAVTTAIAQAARESEKTDLVEFVRTILGSQALHLTPDDSVWIRYSPGGLDTAAELVHDAQAAEMVDVFAPINNYVRTRRSNYSSESRDNAREFLRLQLSSLVELPRVRLVQASRRIAAAADGGKADGDQELSGVGLIARLGALQSPTLENDGDRERFAAINEFLKTVLDDSTAVLEVPQAANQLNVRRRDLLLPLENLGTGVSQVVILAAAATLETDTLICMEEPEVHLHPLLQRKLLRYLHDSTSNQYLIATHSAHLLDSEIASVFHATFTDEGTTVTFAGQPSELSEICYDLGYRPSDLLQTNCAIWVEGPSDRIYLSHWLRLVNPNLREGIDYTIMFYGGRLLNHLTPRDPDVDEFISLRRLNRHLAVVIDSDKPSQNSRINDTKQRVRDTTSDPGLVWITQGRNIENYVPPQLLSQILQTMYPKKNLIENTSRWSDVLRPKLASDKWRADKVKVAKEVVRQWKSGLHYLDLHKKVAELATLIEVANGHQAAVAKGAPKSAPSFEVS